MAGRGSRSGPPVPAWVQRVLGSGPVKVLRAVLDTYSVAGGGLLAGGLAYAALFALVPGILLILGIAGIVLGDGRLHDAFERNVVSVVPPLRDLLGPAVDDLATRAGSTTLLGAVGLAWGASRFYDSFELAMARVFGGVSRRSFIQKTIRGLASIALLGSAVALETILAGVRAYLEAAAGVTILPVAGVVRLLFELIGPAAIIAAIVVVYRIVPPRRPPWGAILVPALVVAVALVVLARVFAFAAPRLIGAAAVLGTLATVFAVLAWLALAFQALLLGAAWIDARDRAAEEAAMPTS